MYISNIVFCIPVLVPGAAPPIVYINSGKRYVNVSWMTLQCQYRHGNITFYEIHYSSSNFGDNLNQTLNTSSGDETSLQVGGLEEFANYTIEVRAYTAIGPGPYGNPMDVQTLADRKCIVCIVLLHGIQGVSFLFVCLNRSQWYSD